MSTLGTVRSNTADAHVRAEGSNYTTVHDAASGNVSSGSQVTVGQGGNGTFAVYRGCLFFDLSGFGESLAVFAASVTVTCTNDFSTADFTIRMVDGTAVGVSIGTDDYGILKNATAAIADTINTDTWTGTKTFSLNAAGLAVLNGSTTNLKALGIRSEEDINSSEPTTAERVLFASADAGSESDRPLLTIIYDALTVAKPTVTTLEMSAISGTAATARGWLQDIGTSSVTAHGHVLNTSGNPDTGDTVVNNGAGSVGTYTSAIANLVVGTKYYIAAYAINSTGTSYGRAIRFIAGDKSSQMIVGNLAVVGTGLHYQDEQGVERYITGTPVV